MANILILRFSALGDVAMTLPVVHALATQYPQHRITVVSRDRWSALYDRMPANVTFLGVDLRKEYAGWKGLRALYRRLSGEGFDYVADLHDVLRSKYLRWRFLLAGARVAHIRKGRSGKRRLARRRNKIFAPQPTSFERYAAVLERLGFPVRLAFRSLYGEGKGDLTPLLSLTGPKGTNRWIGVAPFAAHRGKIYPEDRMEQVLSRLARHSRLRVFLFGGGPQEVICLKKWEERYPNVVSVAGRLKMDGEIALMSQLDVMIAMDSANMHLASLVHIPVVSVWGATHLYAGFMGWGQDESTVIQEDLPCRPCSVYGNKPCWRGDYACLQIAPERIVKCVEQILNKL